MAEPKNDEDELGRQRDARKGKMFIFWSFMAALTMAVTSFLRTIVADTPYASFFVLSFGYLLVSGVVLGIVKMVKKADFRMAWYRKMTRTDSSQDVTNEVSLLPKLKLGELATAYESDLILLGSMEDREGRQGSV
mmetsp:Transcript_4977/g.6632  ORF Transcript_4977/g.6632 Transcript_4977/m.6632 type:complete len:135 (-) Transcript_4977:845-1249(-)